MMQLTMIEPPPGSTKLRSALQRWSDLRMARWARAVELRLLNPSKPQRMRKPFGGWYEFDRSYPWGKIFGEASRMYSSKATNVTVKFGDVMSGA